MASANHEKRFWGHVTGGGVETCWLWTASHIRGYGKWSKDGRSYLAHRSAYEQLRGEIPEGLQLDHLCRTTLCVNPWHLEPVTPAINTRRASPAQQTHCTNGHKYTPENTYMRPTAGSGRRDCRACIRERVRTYRQRRRAA